MGLVLEREGAEMNFEQLLYEKTSGYDEKFESDKDVIKKLQKPFSGNGVQNFAYFVSELSGKIMEAIGDSRIC